MFYFILLKNIKNKHENLHNLHKQLNRKNILHFSANEKSNNTSNTKH